MNPSPSLSRLGFGASRSCPPQGEGGSWQQAVALLGTPGCDKAQRAPSSITSTTSVCQTQLSNRKRHPKCICKLHQKHKLYPQRTTACKKVITQAKIFSKADQFSILAPLHCLKPPRTVSSSKTSDFAASEEKNSSTLTCSHNHKLKYSLHFCARLCPQTAS